MRERNRYSLMMVDRTGATVVVARRDTRAQCIAAYLRMRRRAKRRGVSVFKVLGEESWHGGRSFFYVHRER